MRTLRGVTLLGNGRIWSCISLTSNPLILDCKAQWVGKSMGSRLRPGFKPNSTTIQLCDSAKSNELLWDNKIDWNVRGLAWCLAHSKHSSEVIILLLLLRFLPPSPLLIPPFLLLVYSTTSLQADWFADWLIDSNMTNQEKVVQEKRKGLWTEEKMKVGSWFLIRKIKLCWLLSILLNVNCGSDGTLQADRFTIHQVLLALVGQKELSLCLGARMIK